ncbi:MAG: HDOD domain-containing protein [Polyangiaceae bacterium]|nr:HDOD domain-containing protein [Polyangiaceae bacterium]MCB9609117.1 HDOD domain-containing protein [Polyangiaceae bacterium]
MAATDKAAPSLSADSIEAQMGRELERELLEGRLELPVLPLAAQEVVRAAGDPRVDAEQLAELIEEDPSLSAHLLRLANSSWFRARSEIGSLGQAVVRMGSARVREAALVIGCQTAVFAAPGFESEVRRIFRRSFACALFSQEIARHRRDNVDDAFTAGLLLDVGYPALLSAGRLIAQRLKCRNRPALIRSAEQLHPKAAATIFRAWNFPERLALVAEFHHADSPPEDVATLVHQAHLACCLTEIVLARQSSAERRDWSAAFEHASLLPLELYPDDVEEIIKQAPRVLDSLGGVV